jgi:DNA-binding transcriptional ArsR family regulator
MDFQSSKPQCRCRKSLERTAAAWPRDFCILWSKLALFYFSEVRQYHFVVFFIDKMDLTQSIQALGNHRRLQILKWLKDPQSHFPPQRDGDLVKDGVCGLLIARKLRVSHSAVTQHLKILSQVGLLRSKRIKKWTFYKRNENAIQAVKRAVSQSV